MGFGLEARQEVRTVLHFADPELLGVLTIFDGSPKSLHGLRESLRVQVSKTPKREERKPNPTKHNQTTWVLSSSTCRSKKASWIKASYQSSRIDDEKCWLEDLDEASTKKKGTKCFKIPKVKKKVKNILQTDCIWTPIKNQCEKMFFASSATSVRSRYPHRLRNRWFWSEQSPWLTR